MKKKILVAAVGAALSVGVVAAQAAEVKISGYANVSVDMINGNTGKGTDNTNDMGVSSNSSNIVISASEDLGNGLKGVAVIQEFFRMDNLGSSAGASCSVSDATPTAGEYTCSSSASTSNRQTAGNAYVGLQGGFGLIKFGSHDTPAKLVGRSVDLFGNQLGDTRNLGVSGTRAQNVLAYVSPNMGGFSFALAHSTNLSNGTANEGSTSANAVLLKYEMPGLMSIGLAADMASTENLPAGSDDQEWKILGASFGPFGGAKINLLYQMNDNVESVTTADDTVIGLGAAFTFGANTIKAQYTTYERDNAATLDATMMSVGYDHAFSKAFTGYVAYAQTDNETGAARSMAGGGHGDNPGTVTGKDPSGFQVGLVLKF